MTLTDDEKELLNYFEDTDSVYELSEINQAINDWINPQTIKKGN